MARLVGEVSDLISSYSKTQVSPTAHLQHDVFVTIGLVIGD
jgi:hypothetical protein